jgi:hypothetical protein
LCCWGNLHHPRSSCALNRDIAAVGEGEREREKEKEKEQDHRSRGCSQDVLKRATVYMGGWSGLGSDAVLTYVAMFIVFPPFPSEDMLYTGRLSFCHGILPLLLRLLPPLPAAPLPLPMPPLLMHILSPPKHKALDRRASAHTHEHAIATITAQILGVILLAGLVISCPGLLRHRRSGGVDENGRVGLDFFLKGCALGDGAAGASRKKHRSRVIQHCACLLGWKRMRENVSKDWNLCRWI